MKTIEVSDEMYDKLIELATEMTTQDPRCTRKPHIFQIQTRYKVYDANLNGDVKIYYDPSDGQEIESCDELIELLESSGIEYPSDIREMWEDSWVTSDDEKFDGQSLSEFMDEYLPNLEESSYSWGYKYENCFFTAKACKEHIESNHYHYNDPKDYLNHAWRNPEMDLVSEFLCGLVGKKMHT